MISGRESACSACASIVRIPLEACFEAGFLYAVIASVRIYLLAADFIFPALAVRKKDGRLVVDGKEQTRAAAEVKTDNLIARRGQSEEKKKLESILEQSL